jgi:methyl-accepting chemotaxis protein
MSKELLEVIVPLLIGPPLGILTIRYFFKGSILFKITVYWVITLSILDALANLNSSFPEIFPTYLVILIGLPIFIYFFYRTAKEVRRPLDDSIKALKQLAEGNLNVKISKLYLGQKNELGVITESIQTLALKFKDVIENISNAADEIESTGQQLSSSSLQLSNAFLIS